jgi:hypothetical protein
VEVTTKRVSFDMGRVEDPEKKRLDEVEELSRKLSSMRVNDTAYVGCYMRLKAIDSTLVEDIPLPWSGSQDTYAVNAAGVGRGYAGGGGDTYAGGRSGWGNQRPSSAGTGFSCFFCGVVGHMLRECPLLEKDYISKGHCKVGMGNRLVYMDGSSIMPLDGLLKNTVDVRI